jgi:hypothetical protein
MEVIWALKDIMSGKVIGLNVTSITETSAKANWTAMTGAKQYQIRYDTVVDTSDTPVSKLVGSTPSSTPPTTYTMQPLTNNTQYTVKVRVVAGQPFQSRWSDSVTFTTLQSVNAPSNLIPENGHLDMPLMPTFDWSDVTGAVSYEFELATSDDFSGAVTATSTVSNLTWRTALLYDTDYKWRVRAVGSTGAKGSWVVSTFHTMLQPVTPTTTVTSQTLTVSIPPQTQTTIVISQPPATSIVIPPQTTIITTTTNTTVSPVVQLPTQAAPVYVWAIVAIGALLTLAVIILIIRTRRVV